MYKSEKAFHTAKPFLPPLDDFCKALVEIWDNQWLTNNGPILQRYQQELKKYFKTDYISINNLKEIFFATLLFITVVGLSFLGDILGGEIDPFSINYKEMFADVIIKYIVMVVVVLFISSKIYSGIYDKAKGNLDKYSHNLELLQKFSSNKGE